MDRHDLVGLAEQTQHVLSPSTRVTLGLSPSAWDRFLRTKGIDRPFRGVGVLPGAPDRARCRARAALAAVRCPAVLTGRSALQVYGVVDAAPTEVHLLTPHGASVTRRAGVRLTETSHWPQRRYRDGIPLAPPARCLADLAATTETGPTLDIAIDARFADLLGDGALDEELAARRRFPGRRRLREVADRLRFDDSDSGFEIRARHDLTACGLPPDPEQQCLTVGGRQRRIDLPYAAHMVGIECLGLQAHSGRRAFDADAERRNDFAELDTWLVLELTWTTFVRDWDRFVARLRRVLAARRPA